MRGFCFALLLPAAALAHQPSVSYSELDVRGREIAGVLRFSLVDLRGQMRIDDPASAPLPALGRLVLEPFRIRAPLQPCALQSGFSAHPDGEDGLAVQARWVCPQPIEELTVQAGFLESFPPGHTHLARIQFGPDEVSQRVAQRDEPSFEARRTRDAGREFRRFLLLGVGHIFGGTDHLAFLIGLLLLGGTLLELVKIVTAFTVAHSITLALAALDLVAPPARLIEPLIAAALRHRWMLTFAFGLVHGFGFAAVLRQLQLPRAALASGLVAFNLGVECGQVCIVVVALPALRWLRRFRWFAPIASACILALGATWLVLRAVLSH